MLRLDASYGVILAQLLAVALLYTSSHQSVAVYQGIICMVQLFEAFTRLGGLHLHNAKQEGHGASCHTCAS